MELAGDPEAVTRDEDAIEHDGRAGGVERHALGARRPARRTRQPSSRASRGPRRTAETALAERAVMIDAELELEHLAQRRHGEIGA